MGISSEMGTIFNTQPEREALEGNFMSIMNPGGNSRDPVTMNVLAGLGRANQTVKQSGQQRGVQTADVNQTVQGMKSLEPAARGQLKDLSHGVAGQVESLVDPRFAWAYKPDVENVTEPGTGAEAMSYAQLAIGVATVLAVVL